MHQPRVRNRLIAIVIGQRQIVGFGFNDKEVAVASTHKDVKPSSDTGFFATLANSELLASDLDAKSLLEL